MFQSDAHQTNAFQDGPGTFPQTSQNPLGWEIPPFQPPRSPTTRQRFHGVKGRSGFAFFRTYQEGWQLPPFQPPHPRVERAGAIMPSDQGIYSTFVPPVIIPRGWDIAPFQPPHPPQPDGRFGGLVKGDEGIYAPFIRFLPYGWEIPSPQPRHPRPEAAGAFMPSEAGIEAQYVFVPPTAWGWEIGAPHLRRTINYGPAVGGSADFVSFFFQPFNWEIPSFQPPNPRQERYAAIATSEPGIEAKFVFNPPSVNWGWEGQPSLLTLRYLPQGRSMPDIGDQGIEATFIRFLPSGWEIAPPLTRHQVLKNPDIGDQGTQSPFIRFLPWGWEIVPPLTRDQVFKNPDIGDQGTQATFIKFQPYGWEIAPVQPPHPRREKAGAIMPWEQGIEAQFVFVPSTPVIWGWEIAAPHLRKSTTTRYFGTEGTSDFAFFDFLPYGWELPPFQPPHPRAEKSGAIPTGDQGTQFIYTFVPHTFFQEGWQIPSFQPPAINYRAKTAALKAYGSIETSPFTFQPFNWHIQPHQPSHPRSERAGAIMPSEPGIESVYVFVPFTVYQEGWQIQPFQPPATSERLNRFAGTVRGQDGTEFPFVRFLPSGWEIAPFQPPHPRPERSAAIMPSEAGIEAQYVFVSPPFFTMEWQARPWQPPHPRPERWAALARGDEGIQFPFIRFFPYGWPIAPHQPQHPRPERAGSIVRGDEGIQAKFIRWFNMGWEIPPYQPQHPRFERAGSIMVGHQGIDGIYVFVPPPILARFDPNYLTYGQRRVTITIDPARLAVSYPQLRTTVTPTISGTAKPRVFILDLSNLDGFDVIE